jgi:hypothetical protein
MHDSVDNEADEMHNNAVEMTKLWIHQESIEILKKESKHGSDNTPI